MKKILQLIFILAAITLLLASCKIGGDNGSGNTNTDTGNSGTNGSGDSGSSDTGDSGSGDSGNSGGTVGDNEHTIWSENISAIIVDSDTAEGAEYIRIHIGSLTGNYPTVSGTDAEDSEHMILLGETGRALSNTAYRRLDRKFDVFELESNGYSAYLIYAEGGSLAIAYTDLFAKMAATEYVQNNIKDKSFSANGTVAAEQFKTTTYVAEKREANREIGYATIESRLGAEAADAVRQLYSLYDESIYVWFANLYDPSSGGFYYSASARDTIGFLPDLESTGQGLNMLVTSGLTTEWASLLTDEMKTKLLLFVYDMQSPDDYYYYHPQWGMSIGSSRRGRDAGWAKDILDGLGQPPKYDKNAPEAASYLVDRVGGSSVAAVSRVVAVAAVASELASEEAFRAFLDDAKISENSYNTFNNLNARTTEIKNAGLWDFLLDYLTEKQYANGLWEPTVSYQSVNGLMKVSTFFNSKKPFPNPDKAIESAMQVLSYTDNSAITQIVYVYNPWVAIKNILPYCSEESYAKYMSILKDNADGFIGSTFEKLALFKREDGGFSYMQDRTAHESQQVLVAVEGTKESDVNSTSIAISTVLRYILRVYDLDPPKLYYKYDTLYFTDTLNSMGEIIKDSAVAEPEIVTFDDYDSNYGDEYSGVVHQPHEVITNNVGDKAMVGTDYLWFTSSIVKNPAEGAKDSDLVLYVADKVYPDADKKVASAQSSTEIRISN